ncbi:MAG: ABC transporter ATP-binding protein [Candidatus Puniceispirillales bacterium]|jgi:ABC-2 type transport system ATP-binding protein|tara:strand:- start:850 stop:1803 length:954 start_codon:yes stop_codon:yes gene_type:complete
MSSNYWEPPKNNLALEINNLSKIYNNEDNDIALDNICLTVKVGSIFGLLGPNGAGKSTLINIISGTVFKTSGNVLIWGIDIDKKRKQSKLAVGVVPQELNIDAFFTPNELLNLHSGMFNVPKIARKTDELLRLMDLSDKAQSYSRKLSGGMRRRLLVAKAMVHTPPILILDEPTAGVDVELRQKLWSHFKELNKLGVTIILTTHYLEEAENLCDHIAIINHGKIVANESKKSLLRKLNEKIIYIKFKNNIDKKSEQALKKIGTIKFDSNELQINFKPDKISMKKIIKIIYETDIDIIDLSTKDASLEDVFINITSKK